MRRAKLQDADLCAAIAVEATLCGAVIYGAELSGADFSRACVEPTTFEGARHVIMSACDKLRSCAKVGRVERRVAPKELPV